MNEAELKRKMKRDGIEFGRVELKNRQDALVRLIHEKKEHLKQIESMYQDLNAYRYILPTQISIQYESYYDVIHVLVI